MSTRSGFGIFNHLPLEQSRDMLTTGYRDRHVEKEIQRIVGETPEHGTGSALSDLQALLESVRSLPPGERRIASMNSFVRTLGRPGMLSMFLDVLRLSLTEGNARDAELAQRSQRGRMHCVYGWAGQTLMLTSKTHPTAGTAAPVDDMDSFLGYPPAEWDMSIHIWQPNSSAQGFASTKRLEPDVIVEPPHSHPFSFVSYVAVGEMHQSIYTEDEGAPIADGSGRYDGMELERVDGVWPPHQEYLPSRLRTVQDRVRLCADNSYFMPPQAIHDVEIDSEQASQTPTITLFLCAEATVKPRAYLAPQMAEYHRSHPQLKDTARALSVTQWQQKLSMVARYLTGQSSTLQLDEVVGCDGSTYGFMHV